MKSIYYICWKTWKEAETVTPFTWYPISHGSIYKRRHGSNSSLLPTKEMIFTAYETKNSELLDEIQQNFIEDMTLCAFVDAEDEQQAKSEICRYFDDADIERCQKADEPTKEKILALFTATLMKKAD